MNNRKSRKTSIRIKLIEIFLVVSILVFLLNSYIYYSLNRMIRQMDDVYSNNIQFNELTTTLDQVQESLYQYLNTKSSDALEDYYTYEQEYRNLMDDLNTVSVNNSIKLSEKNVYYMSETYLEKAGDTIDAKRGRNVTRYKEAYEEVKQIYTFLQSNINSMNNTAFMENSYQYQVLRTSLNSEITISGFILATFLILAIVWIIIMTRNITQPLIRLADAANEIALGNMDVDFPFIHTEDEISTVAKACNKMLDSIRIYIKETRENYERASKLIENELAMKNDLKEAQLKYLQAQINPHFLFNSLNAGAQLAMMEGAEKTGIFIQKMADFFRYNVRKMDKDTTLAEELSLIDSYIYILNVRFTGDIHYYRQVDDRLLDTIIPGMILQPIVENSVNHGIREMEGDGVIQLSVYEKENHICIRIADNGKGIEEELAQRIMRGELVREEGEEAGIGLDNVISRMKRYYEVEHVIDIAKRPEGGTDVILCLPKKGENSNNQNIDL